jgi:tripartite-type tricarboxylate transporter receptor subunit TctC
MLHFVRWSSIAFALLLLAMPNMAQAQGTYPDRPIRFVIAFPPGGATDTFFRVISNDLATALGASIVIENKGGAGGSVGTEIVSKAAADGYTVLFTLSSHTINPAIFPKLNYDTLKDFEPVGLVASLPQILVAGPQFAANTVAEMTALAKAAPGTMAFASVGNGSPGHLAGELHALRIGTPLTHIPYRGGGPALNDVMGGQVPLFFANVASSLGHIQSGRLRALAVTSRLRSRVLPDLPSMEEAGLKGYEVLEWNPVLAPAGVPAAVRAPLAAALRKAMADPEVLARVRTLGGEVFGGGEAEAGSFLKAQQAQWARVVRERRITRE